MPINVIDFELDGAYVQIVSGTLMIWPERGSKGKGITVDIDDLRDILAAAERAGVLEEK